MTHISMVSPAVSDPSFGFGVGGIKKIIGQIAAVVKKRRDRVVLERLPDHMLKDIGISRGQIEALRMRQNWGAPGGSLRF